MKNKKENLKKLLTKTKQCDIITELCQTEQQT